MSEFQEFPKMARLSREVIITEKIDGTNIQVFISDDRTFIFLQTWKFKSKEKN